MIGGGRDDRRKRARGGSFRRKTGRVSFFSRRAVRPVPLPFSLSLLSVCLYVRTRAFSFLPYLSALPLPPPAPRPYAGGTFVYALLSVVARISVWSSSGGFVVMTTNPGNPATLSYPFWLSRGSLSILSSSLPLSFSLLPAHTRADVRLAPSSSPRASAKTHSGPLAKIPLLSLSLSLLCSLCNHANSRLRLLRALSRARAFPPGAAHVHTHTLLLCRPSLGSSTFPILSPAAAHHPRLRGWRPRPFARSPSPADCGGA